MGLFGCFKQAPALPRSRKENALWMNIIIMNSDEIFMRLGKDEGEFRDRNRRWFQERTGEAINAAISTLYEDMCATHSVADMAQGIRRGAQSSTAMDDIGNEEEMVNLRDKWLRRINNQQSLEHSESSDVKTGEGFITLPIFYATNRNLLTKSKSGSGSKRVYGTGRHTEVNFGVNWMSLPDQLGYGDVDGSIWRYSANRKGAPRKKIVAISAVPVLERACVGKMNNVMRSLGESEAILFVHGYNSTLANATKRLAQVAYIGNFRGPSFVFSWPSNESMTSYTADEANVMWAVPDFVQTLYMLLTEMGMAKVHLLAHSMGSRLVIYGLLRLHAQQLPQGAAKLGRLVLAAPDFDMGEFMHLVSDVTPLVEKITLYCAADDQALHLSRSLHGGYPRLGDFRGLQEMKAGDVRAGMEAVDAIDTTGTDSSWMRHAYVFDACGIVMDCCVVLRVGLPPSGRKPLVLARLPSGQAYYSFSGGVSMKVGHLMLMMSSQGTAVSGADPVLPRDAERIQEEEGREGERGKERVRLSRAASRRVFDEFGGGDLELKMQKSVGGTLIVEDEESSQVGGGDVEFSGADMDKVSDSFKRTFQKSRSVSMLRT